MTERRIASITIELDGATVVVRDPFGPSPQVAVAGDAPPAAVERALEQLGLSGSPPRSLRTTAIPIAFEAPPPSLRPEPPPASPSRVETLPRALIDLAVATLRAGRSAPTTSVDEAMESLRRHVEDGPLPAIARLLSRLQPALDDARGLEETAVALAAIGRVARSVSAARVLAGDGEALELSGIEKQQGALADAVLIEIGRLRERRPVSWETRLLLDPGTGTRYRECGPLRSGLSLGPPGRTLLVSFGARLASSAPARVQIFHYEYRPAAEPEALERVVEHATRSLAIPEALRTDPLALVATPVAELLRPARVATGKGGSLTLLDDDGRALGVTDAGALGATEALLELVERGDSAVRALAGAFVVGPRGIGFQPWTAIVQLEGRPLGVVQLAL